MVIQGKIVKVNIIRSRTKNFSPASYLKALTEKRFLREKSMGLNRNVALTGV
jgi:hypothetical protein